MKDLETHLGYLMGVAVRTLKDREDMVLEKLNYTANGVVAEMYYPFDNKTYVVTIQEKETANV